MSSFIDRWHWHLRQALPFILMGFCILLGASLVWYTLVRDDGSGSRGSKDAHSNSPSAVVPEDNPEQPAVTEGDKKMALMNLQGFVPAYFGRTDELYEGSPEQTFEKYRLAVEPFATDSFIKNYVAPLDSHADISMERDGSELRASMIARSLVGHFDDEDEAEVNFEMRFDLISADGRVNRIRSYVFVTLIKENGQWQVNSIQEL